MAIQVPDIFQEVFKILLNRKNCQNALFLENVFSMSN